MKTELPRNKALLEALQAEGSALSLEALKALRELYSIRDDYFAQIIEQCDEIDELIRRMGGD